MHKKRTRACVCKKNIVTLHSLKLMRNPDEGNNNKKSFNT